MKHKNLFIVNYSRIEHEVIELSHSIDFCDKQIDVRSIVICDLIIRCGTDIESLYKELYRCMINSKLPKTVGETVIKLNEYLGLADKTLAISNARFNFDNFSEIRPFSYSNRADGDFYHVFCCLKHDRQKSFQKATLGTLMLALGALYILNQYYLDEWQLIENTFFGETIPTLLSKDTLIFSARVFNKAWFNLDSQLNKLNKQAGFSTESFSKLKNTLVKKTNTQLECHACSTCLFRVEATPEYNAMTKAFAAENANNEAVRAAVISQMFDDKRVVDELLDKRGTEIIDATLSMLNIAAQRHRLRIVMNK